MKLIFIKLFLIILLSFLHINFCFEIIIANSGHAMKHEYMNIGFNDFASNNWGQIKDNTVDSTSLGLDVAKQYIKMMNGTIEFINEKGMGTQYHIFLEQKVIDRTPIGDIFENQSKDVPEHRILDLTGKNILVVDDSNITRNLIEHIFKDKYIKGIYLNGDMPSFCYNQSAKI